MATKKATYVEPGDYFSPNMKKAMDEWEKKNAAKQKQEKKPAPKKK